MSASSHLFSNAPVKPSQTQKRITILGATGSIGTSTLDVLALHPDEFSVFAVSGMRQLTQLASIIQTFSPRYAVVSDKASAATLTDLLAGKHSDTQIIFGTQALIDIASDPDVDIVMSAIVGAAGLMPTLAAVKAGKRVLLANKEALVMSGELFINAVNEFNAQLIPIDSEHNAIFQCLPTDFVYGDKASSGISHLLLTGSGGPFRELALSEFAHVTPAQACKHPNWSMGQKISVDSASMMNKGLEFIEAKWLFGFAEDDIKVVIHPQSTIHSMVQYVDGSVIAQLGNPDMRTPIAYGLSYPERIQSGVKSLDFAQIADFSFTTPCAERFPNLYLAMQASRQGQAATTALNAANEIAVDAFLQEQISFVQINHINDATLQQLANTQVKSIEAIIAHDNKARIYAAKLVKEFAQ
jgi:1-deoxy-D-xylulose-5-phosphate reductoisomerase